MTLDAIKTALGLPARKATEPQAVEQLTADEIKLLGHVRRGIDCLNARDLPGVRECARQALLISANYPEPYVLVAMSYILEGDPAHALLYTKTALTKRPGDARATLTLIYCLTNSDPAEARRLATEFASKAAADPEWDLPSDHADVLKYLGNCALADGNVDEAESLWAQAKAIARTGAW